MREMLMVANYEQNMSGTIILKMNAANTSAELHGSVLGEQGILYLGAKDVTYSIDHKEKTFSLNEKDSVDRAMPDITDTKETDTIAGHFCKKYRVVTDGHTLTYVWTTDEMKDMNLSKVLSGSWGIGSPLFFKHVTGIPLRFQRILTSGVTTTEVHAMYRVPIPSSAFEIPSDYTETEN